MVFKRSFDKKNNSKNNSQEGDQVIRVRIPRENEVLGILEQRLGASRNKVRCFDGKSRVCRIPGKLKRKLWVRENDIVLVEPWEFGGDEKGDVVFKYKQVQVDILKKKGYLDNLDDMNEF
ncbi:translation initiation factor eIF-1A [Candidatus Woesearchaeota archaeon]|nr:translation initiation factor eIF-1A [Candidatus Woesearchaeota archaeon]